MKYELGNMKRLLEAVHRLKRNVRSENREYRLQREEEKRWNKVWLERDL